MEISSISIQNFKGIESTSINFDKCPNASVFTLVGPNECGKTTVLEAIHSIKSDMDNQAVLIGVDDRRSPNDNVPISKRGSFTGDIKIGMNLKVSDDEIKKVKAAFMQKFGHELNHTIPANMLAYYISDHFEAGDHKQNTEAWGLDLFNVQDKTNVNEVLATNDPATVTAEELQPKIRELNENETAFLQKEFSALLPKILYFPNLLSRFPEKIYLEQDDNPDATQREINLFYLKILQDVLTVSANEPKLSVKSHIHDRLKLNKDDERDKVKSLLEKMGNKITEDIQSEWNKIFSQEQSLNQEVKLEYDSDKGSDNQDRHFIKILVKEGANSYSIQQRSLGFKWFFCFFLFTLYRAQSESIVYLFDEPASNLHPKAQKKLLESLEKMAKKAKVVYSTHSHHLIKPEWLEAAFVVRNEAVNYKVAVDARPKNTQITAIPYRQFVNENPSDTDYFQAILNALDYQPSHFEKIDNAILIEGKTDFYHLSYFADITLKAKLNAAFMPGFGAGTLGSLVSLYQGWGKDFIILLDSDTAGNDQADKYINEHLVPKERIFTLADIDARFAKHTIEKMYLPEDTQRLLGITEAEAKASITKYKKPLAFKIQELYARKEAFGMSKDAKSNFKAIIDFCNSKFPSKEDEGKKAA